MAEEEYYEDAEDFVKKQIAKFIVDTFDGQEDSTYKYIHIDKAKEIALKAVKMAYDEGNDSGMDYMQKVFNE